MKNHIILIFSIFLSLNSTAQDDLLNELDSEIKIETYQLPAFKAMKIGNLQSTKIAEKGDLYMIVSHRFGTLKNGLKTFFGFDDANTKMQLLYSFIDGVQVSLSRESLNRTYAGGLKIGLFKQSNNFPFNIVAYGTANINTLIDEAQYPELKFGDKMSYAAQLLVSRRFSSFIYKEDNVYGDRAIKDYKNPGLEAILESERIKKEILDFEQDMWNR